MNRSGEEALRVALDTTYAGINSTGVGLYSSRLASELYHLAPQLSLDLRCFGAACPAARPMSRALGTFQEWPTYTHGVLPAQLLAYRPQIVHSTSHIGPIWGPARLVVTVHDLIFMRFPQDYQRGWLAITRALLPIVLRRASAVVADSAATARDLQRLFGVRRGKIVVIYPGIDPVPERTVALSAKESTADKPYILCLGPWVRRKNLDVVLRAFGQVAAHLPDLQIVLTGDKPRGMRGYSRYELLNSVPGEFRSRVQLTGYVSGERKQALVSGASLLCYPSRLEGFGLPPLEAMAAGVPVLASKTPAVAEVTAGAALLANPDDTDEWSVLIERVISDHGLAQRLREAGFERSAEFTWSRCAEQTARLYRRVAASPGSRRSR